MGGAQTRFCQLASAYGPRYRHTVIALDGNYAMANIVPEGIPVEYWKEGHDKNVGLLNLAHIRLTLRKIAADLLVTYNWGAIEWCLANRWFPILPHVHIEDGFGPEESQRQLLRRVLVRRIALSGRQTTIVLPSKQLERLARETWCLPANSIRYIPNGVDCRRFTKPPHPARLFGEAVVIGTVATLRREKNLVRLIDAYAAIASDYEANALRLVIVGDGPERSRLEAVAIASGQSANILFTGAVSKTEHTYAAMDIFSLSSDTEQMPLSLLEAMACELPVAAVAVGDVRDMVAEANRPYITAPEDEKGFRDNLRALVADSGLRTTLGQANRKVALEQFDQKLMVDRYAQLFG